ncbi:hypothetical protein CH375_01425 [Leptospira ellisii]|uniref:Uncharacterized protein n=1 Tax=Leptospira ellisii TaxID=2023197 RepID=A0A2N0BQ93_9LEPT|nr:hypothetical protein CH379_16945 [Leptospira ellisii]PKA06114.1 hypothetical protein CH375_01425 [Leptospira ellisii]
MWYLLRILRKNSPLPAPLDSVARVPAKNPSSQTWSDTPEIQEISDTVGIPKPLLTSASG